MPAFTTLFKSQNAIGVDDIADHVAAYHDPLVARYDPKDGFSAYELFVTFWEFYQKYPNSMKVNGVMKMTWLVVLEQGDPLGVLVCLRKVGLKTLAPGATPLLTKVANYDGNAIFQQPFLRSKYVNETFSMIARAYQDYEKNGVIAILKRPTEEFIDRLNMLAVKIQAEIVYQGKGGFETYLEMVKENLNVENNSSNLKYNMWYNFFVMVQLLSTFSFKYDESTAKRISSTYRVCDKDDLRLVGFFKKQNELIKHTDLY